jgi:amino acid adenylation domain-containing protein
MNPFLLQHYLYDSFYRDPDKTAVTDGGRSISYRELSFSSNSVAHCLQTMGVLRQDRVALFLQRSVDCVTSILGILKADAIYVPIDQKVPGERLVFILGDAAPKVLICDSKTISAAHVALHSIGVTIPILLLGNESRIPEGIPGKCLDLEKESSLDPNEPTYLNDEDDIAYILYTSGSTGRPKGVMISHGNVKSYIDWAAHKFNVHDGDKILGTAPFYFDMSTFDIYCALKTGATLCIAADILTLFPEKLVNFIEQQQVTLWKGVSSLLMYMARTGALRPGTMQTLKRVLFAGETLPTQYLIDWMTAFPEKTFYNAYGPTEATGVSICYCVDKIPKGPQVRIPIGTPRDETGVLLLSENHTEVPPGEPGEVCISGRGLARGYLNDPVKTGNAFIVNPLSSSGERIYKTGDLARFMPDGNLEYLGRKDRQLKFMGYRIEAGEIEQALLAIPQVKDSAVVLMESKLGGGTPELAAFWEAEGDLDVTMISSELKKRLPIYMIPKRLIRVGKMPRCSRGKIDWHVLKEKYQTV